MATTPTEADLPPDLLAHCRRAAGCQAVVAAMLFDHWCEASGLTRAEFRLPPALMLEFGALAQLAYWEARGLQHLLPKDVPDVESARSDLIQRMIDDPLQFRAPESATLSLIVWRCVCTAFSWNAQELLGAEIVVEAKNDDA